MITIFTDGALEPGAPANGWAVCAFIAFKGVVSGRAGAKRPPPLHQQHGYIGRYAEGNTSVTAEFRALVAALKWAQRLETKEHIEIRTDSQIAERAVNGFHKCRAQHLLSYCVEAQKILVDVPHLRVVWVTREEVDVADALTRIALRKAKKNGHTTVLTSK